MIKDKAKRKKLAKMVNKFCSKKLWNQDKISKARGRSVEDEKVYR